MEIMPPPRTPWREQKKKTGGGKTPNITVTRRSNEYSAEHIKGSVNVYYDPAGYPMDREMVLSGLPPDNLIVFYCDCTDDSTSALMVMEMVDLRYDADKVKALSGGILRWKELGYPVEASS